LVFEGSTVGNQAAREEAGDDTPEISPDERGGLLAMVRGIKAGAEAAKLAGGNGARNGRRHGGGGDEHLGRVLEGDSSHLSSPPASI
jgi:hypothetical protein